MHILSSLMGFALPSLIPRSYTHTASTVILPRISYLSYITLIISHDNKKKSEVNQLMRFFLLSYYNGAAALHIFRVQAVEGFDGNEWWRALGRAAGGGGGTRYPPPPSPPPPLSTRNRDTYLV
jgi:hypothetical protein